MKGIPLTKVGLAEEKILVSFNEPLLANKLLSMGMLPGMKLKIAKKLWGGQNYFIIIEDQKIVLRKEEAAAIIVK